MGEWLYCHPPARAIRDYRISVCVRDFLQLSGMLRSGQLRSAKKGLSPLPKLSWEGGRGNAASQNTTVIRDFYVRDFAANPNSGILRSVACTINK